MPHNSKNEKAWIVHLTTFPPRECGLATFCFDLITYFEELFNSAVEHKVVAMNTADSPREYSKKVILEIREDNPEEYIKVALKLNSMPEVALVSIQHEYGIFGNNYGENILLFLGKIEKPVVVTLHTVLSEPHPKMKEVMQKILTLADRFVVMTQLSKQILVDVYGAKGEKIKIIPHGIHPALYVEPEEAKKELKLENKLILSTFGLLNSGKGIEYAIEALPAIIAKFPNTVYLVLGATHPVVLAKEGEKYRNGLVGLAKKLGVEKNVVFHNRYLSRAELLLFLEATDIYIAPSLDPNHTVSGTLTSALGAGRPVISTSFMQAKEVVTKEVGSLVPFRNSKEITVKAIELLEDLGRRVSMSRAAYFTTRGMTWPNIALSYMSLFSELVPQISANTKGLLPIKIDHLQKLTDDFGVLQFATLNNPDPTWGYTLDDNARALVALVWHYKTKPEKDAEKLIEIYLNFIERSSDGKGGFINYFDEKREPHPQFNKNKNLEDTEARGFWALAIAAQSDIPTALRERAEQLFQIKFKEHKNVKSPRAAALYIKAFAQYFHNNELKAEVVTHIRTYADFLVDLFERSRDERWQWFEESLTYSNGLLPEALLIAYSITENPFYFRVAEQSLTFLLEHSFEGDVCVPVGQAGWYKKGEKKYSYDQQPEEVSALVFALVHMAEISTNPVYARKLVLAFDWFLGNNLSKQIVYTPSTGGSYDGIMKGGINLNQGAESTISYLLARLVMERKD